MKYIIGAYASAPSGVSWNKELETEYYQQLKSQDNIGGIEHPFTGTLHPFDDEWFLNNIDKDWQFVFTSIPGVMAQLAKNPHFGIASTNEAGRQAAIAFYQQAQVAIKKLNDHLGRQAVSAIMIHTAPKITEASQSSIAALEASLTSLQSSNWHGAKLVIEHCDAYVAGQAPAKGFMRLEDEITAITNVNKALNGDIGICINWGRSAIETRSTTGPLQHIELAKKANLLTGLMFSGASDYAGPYGQWQDTHMPPAQALGIKDYAEHSLLTLEQIRQCIALSTPSTLGFLGAKISLRPNQACVEQRVSYVNGLTHLMQSASETV
ncbi:DUF4862 family protein [Shewanella sp. SNU WT4]|uniref:DUF4862 family protein n=1 Tax=Shewanella sp. SNU WT4 TaxID=2590015 RepID=UPI00112ADEAC|nr:DUF4862 family protein [Shewanella sp. SNU WT4]QDF68242.1 DUF4862 family protein [Shewanella sp. SNU WT4]